MKNAKHFIFIVLSLIATILCKAEENPTPSIAFTNITLIDVVDSQSLNNMTIVIENDKIKSILPTKSEEPKNVSEVLDMTGHYLIPGLIDAHVHLFRRKDRKQVLKNLLYSGITSVRDMGGDARVYQNLVQEITNGDLEGPNIYYSANVFGPTFLKDPRTKFSAQGFEPGEAAWSRLITDSTNLEKVVSEAKGAGVTGLKVYSNITPDLLEKICDEAHQQGLKMWSHSSIYPSKPSDAVNGGVDVLSHGAGMIFETQTNMPASFIDAINNYVIKMDFQNTNATSQKYVALFENMKANGTIFEPTLSAWNTTIRAQQNKQKSQEKVNPTAHLAEAGKKIDAEAVDNWTKRITKAAYDNGVTIAAGTDLSKDVHWVQDEIKFLTECGIPNIEAIKAATLNNAKVIGIEDTHGSISTGKHADFVILSKNPLDNIENIKTVTAVYKDGKNILNKIFKTYANNVF